MMILDLEFKDLLDTEIFLICNWNWAKHTTAEAVFSYWQFIGEIDTSQQYHVW